MSASGAPSGGERPAVAIVVPFAGSAGDLDRVITRFNELSLGPADTICIVDNSPKPNAPTVPLGRVTLGRATREGSSYHARNVGAASTDSEWLLFIDADCLPDAGIIDAYFAAPPAEGVGAVAGGIRPAATTTTVGQFAALRGHLDPAEAFTAEEEPFGVTANMLVRRSALLAVGGFAEGIRSGGDRDLCIRLQKAGWKLDLNLQAAVDHEHRETVKSLARQFRRYGSGGAWLRRRHHRPSPFVVAFRRLIGAVLRFPVALVRGRRVDATNHLLDAVTAVAEGVGAFEHNRPRWSLDGEVPVSTGIEVSVTNNGHVPAGALEVVHRSDIAAAPPGDVRFWEDDSYGERVLATAKLALIAVRTRDLQAGMGLWRLGAAGAPAALRAYRASLTVVPVSPADEQLAAQLNDARPR